MALNPTIFWHVPAQAIPKRVTPEFRDAIDVARLEAGRLYTVLSYPGMHGNATTIVNSASLRRALRRAGSDEAIVAVAYDFTNEAMSLLRQCAGIAFAMSNSCWWSDALLARVHEFFRH